MALQKAEDKRMQLQEFFRENFLQPEGVVPLPNDFTDFRLYFLRREAIFDQQ